MEEENKISKEELISRFREIIDPYRQKQELYDILDQLNVKYLKSSCRRCILDLYNIAAEELNIIENAAEISEFNVEDCKSYRYIHKKSIYWLKDNEKILINQNTSIDIIKEFIVKHRGYYICTDI